MLFAQAPPGPGVFPDDAAEVYQHFCILQHVREIEKIGTMMEISLKFQEPSELSLKKW